VRRRLDETKLTKEIQSCRTPTNAELREHLGARLNRTQRLLDRLENGETLDQETQQQHTFPSKASAKRLVKALKKAATTRRPTKTSKDPSAMKGPLASEAPLEEPLVGASCAARQTALGKGEQP
jgi:hypothetical protein